MIRGLLGLVAGLMLAHFMPIDQAARAGIDPVYAKPLLAILGGFAAPRVHRILQRLVDGVDNLFRPDMRREFDIKMRQWEVEQQLAAAERSRKNAIMAAPIISQLRVERDPERWAALLDRLWDLLMEGEWVDWDESLKVPSRKNGSGALLEQKQPHSVTTKNGARAVEEHTNDVSAGAEYLEKIKRHTRIAEAVAGVLTDRRRQQGLLFVAEVQGRAHELESCFDKMGPGDLVGPLKRLLEWIRKAPTHPVNALLLEAYKNFSRTLASARGGSLAGSAIGATGLIDGVLTTGTALGAMKDAFARWKAFAVGASYDPEIMPRIDVDVGTVKVVLSTLRSGGDRFGEVFEAKLGEPEAFARLGELALNARGPEPFLDAYGDTFEGSLDELAAGLERFRWAMLKRVLVEEVPSEIARQTGARDAEEFLAAIAIVRQDENAHADLARLVRCSELVCEGTICLTDLLDALAALERVEPLS
jgi:hypothetical protein